MLTLPEFEFHQATSVDDTLRLLALHGEKARVVAGGTDLLVNMKHRVTEPEVLIGIGGVAELSSIELMDDGALKIGAMATLSQLRESPIVQGHSPVLADATGLIASPQIQNMGTIGGNLCLDTRCIYINQTHFWRKALGYCLKKDGTVCHVIKGGKRCVAAQSSDTVPPLMVLGAEVEIATRSARRRAPVESLYKKDGASHLTLSPEEFVTAVFIPAPREGLRATYQKYRVRKSIDFPAMSLALSLVLDENGVCSEMHAAATCLGSFPRRVRKLDTLVSGQKLTEALINTIADHCQRQINPLDNIMVDTEWRKEMVPVLVKRAIAAALA